MTEEARNDIQIKLDGLIDSGWSMAAISDELESHYNTIKRWRSGHRYPENSKAVMMALDTLLQKKPPPKRRYPNGHYLQRRKAEQEQSD